MSARPEPIRVTPTVRRVRATRAAQRWAETHELQETPIAVLEQAAAVEAERVARDLTDQEIDGVLLGAVEAHVAAAAERAARQARAEQFEAERLAYLARQAAHYRLTADDRVTRPRGQR